MKQVKPKTSAHLAIQAPIWFQIINTLFLLIITFLTIYPFLYLTGVSLSSTTAVLTGQVNLLPVDLDLSAYREIMVEDQFWRGYRNTIVITTVGTLLALFITIIAAYPLSKKDLPGRAIILKLITFTMFFNGGLIPFFLVVRMLGLVDTIWAVTLPGAVNAFYIIVMRTFFQSIPTALGEAAEIDGLSQIEIMLRIVLPLSKPIIATIALFNAVWYYNDFFQALIFYIDHEKYPVTMYLRNIMLGNVLNAQSGQAVDAQSSMTISQTLQAAATMLVIIPMLVIYPFIQKYFVKGIMIGSIKG